MKHAIVPVEPSEAMEAAGVLASPYGCKAMFMSEAGDIFKAMTAAAPDPWTRVEDGLPQDDRFVLVEDRYGDKGAAFRGTKEGRWFGYEDERIAYRNIVKWMELPGD